MSKVSVIMPVYNAEKYLGEAIESVLNQTYADLELLLINDRSADHSKDICEEYCKKDSRVIFLENDSENHGPGPTRNIGLDHASGVYIYFMDADDWIDISLLQCAVTRMQETGADIVQFSMTYEHSDHKSSEQYIWAGKDILTKDEIQKDFFRYWKDKRCSLVMHLFRREKVKSIRFENIISGEDFSYVYDALSYAAKIAYVAKVLYHYRYVNGSTSRRWNKNTIECRAIVWDHQLNFLQSFPGGMGQLAYAEVAYDNYVWAIYQLSSNLCTLTFEEKKSELLKLKEKMEFETYRSLYPLKMQHGLMKLKYALVKYRLESLLLLLGPVFLKVFRGE